MARWPALDADARPGSRSRRAAAACLLAACAFTLLHPTRTTAAAEREDPAALTFALRGVRAAALSQDALARIEAPATVRVFEPYEQREVSFRAVRLRSVLDTVFSTAWRGEEEVLFTCRDGYQPGVPVARVLAHDAWLAFERADQPAFTIEKFESGARRRVALAPFYLIWENLDDAVVRADGDYGWPYQLVALDLIRTRDRFPNMVPPVDADERTLAGFRAFRMQCSRCHRINGDGGTIGQELIRPISPLDYRDEDWLRRWIDDPSALVATARMPRLNPQLADRAQTIDDLLAYLAAMTRARDAAAGGDVPGTREAAPSQAGEGSG